MKILKNALQALTFLLVSVLFFSSCKKVETAEPIGEGGQKIVKFVTYGGYDVNFGNSNLSFSPSSTSEILDLNVEYTAPSVADQDITVEISVDLAALTSYNALQTDPAKKYFILPAAAYTFPTTTVKIKAGQTLSDVFPVEFNPSVIDGSKNFMLPISITKISGAPSDAKKAPGTGTAYFHFIGNPLAGNYSVVGTRYNCSATGDQGWNPPAPIPANFATAAIPTSKFLAPVNPTVTTVYAANLGAGTNRDYSFTIDPTVTTTTDIGVSLTPSFAAGLANVRWFTKTYNPTTKTITLLWTYNNLADGTGNDRIISEVMTKL
jgi:hypothetical protein